MTNRPGRLRRQPASPRVAVAAASMSTGLCLLANDGRTWKPVTVR